ncbi:hypothetical protein J0695_26055 [Streptomyces beijiangensis]|uniref:Secreted protein n=2 Tax=Streptomyces beijiangensis TaxID=163361 RepID=A0A939FB05_9ACTN|nr:hypothetical protein [Streptomyces beijiangensis]MBO0515233.1 hypothetical protein [Streptomyces beijiangensis]
MRRGLIHSLAWTLATGAAVTLSWWGVRTVMSGTVYDPPRALPVGANALGSSTQRPEGGAPSLNKAESGGSGTPKASKSPAARPSGGASNGPGASKPASRSSSAAPPASRSASGEVKSYPVNGGRVVYDIGAASAELVSATPASGWKFQVWKTATWIRVTFTKDAQSTSVFCTWNDHAPTVEITSP